MEELRVIFSDVQNWMETLLNKLHSGGLLTQEDITETVDIMDRLDKEQKRCIQELTEALGTAQNECTTIEEIEAMAEAYRKKQERERLLKKLHGIVDAFLDVRALDEAFRADLTAFQTRLNECDDETLLTMEAEGQMQPYRDFLLCVHAEQPDYNAVNALVPMFGYPLAFALTGRRLRGDELFDEEEAAESNEEPASDADTAPAEAAETAEPAEDTAASEEPTEPTEASDPSEEAAAASERRGDAAAEQTEQTPTDEPSLPHPETDPAELGTLHLDAAAPLKGVKSLQGHMKTSAQMYHASFALRQLCLYPACNFADWEKNNSMVRQELLEQALHRLTKEGIVTRYTLSSRPGQVMYTLTRAGQQFLQKETIQKFFRFRRGTVIRDEELRTSANFLRLYEGQKFFASIFNQDPTLYAEHSVTEGFSTVTLALREQDPITAIVFPIMLFSQEDREAGLQELVKDLRGKLVNHPDVFLTAQSAEEAAAWETYFRQAGVIPAESAVYRGVVGQDEYRTADGTAQSLEAYLNAMRAKLDELMKLPAAAN